MTDIKTLLKIGIEKFFPSNLTLFIKKKYYHFNKNLYSINRELEMMPLKYLVKKGDFVIDVGANIGVYTKYLSELIGPGGKVVSFEPIPETFEILKSNVENFNLSNAELHNIALSDSDGILTMQVPVSNKGTKNYYEARIVSGKGVKSGIETIDVDIKKLDSISSINNYKFTFIKIDVEGHELNCIKGANNFLKFNNPSVLIEISEDPDKVGSTAYYVFENFILSGYKPFWFDGSNFYMRSLGVKKTNYFFFKDKHIEILQRYYNFN